VIGNAATQPANAKQTENAQRVTADGAEFIPVAPQRIKCSLKFDAGCGRARRHQNSFTEAGGCHDALPPPNEKE